MNNENLTLHTSLSPRECVKRLNLIVDKELIQLFPISTTFGSKPAIGRVTESSIQIWKRIAYRNAFQTTFYATIEQEGGITKIQGTFSLNRQVESFAKIWFGTILGLLCVISIISMHGAIFGSDAPQKNTLMFLVVPPALLAFGYALPRFGQFLASGEKNFLKNLLIQSLGATEPQQANQSLERTSYAGFQHYSLAQLPPHHALLRVFPRIGRHSAPIVMMQ